MGRILFWVLVGVVAWLFWRWWQATQRLNAPRRDARVERREGEPMVACRVCGLNVPRSEALGSDGDWYCCEDHRRRGNA